MSARRVVLGALVAALTAVATPASASQTETYALRYDGANYAGWTAQNGGGYLEFAGSRSSVPVPAWAAAVEVRVYDDAHRPVHGVAAAMWHGYQHSRAVFCSSHATTMTVRDATHVVVGIGQGVSTTVSPNGCVGLVSLPTRGTVTLTFRS